MALQFTLQQMTLKAETTVAGVTTYEGGRLEENNRVVGTFIILSETIKDVTDFQNLDTAAVTISLFFLDTQGHHGHGGGGGGGGGHGRAQAPENMVLEGANEFVGQPPPSPPGVNGGAPVQARQTARAIGSVSAASQTLASHIGKQFVRVGDKLTIG
jgi:hypothetical protein